MFFSKKFLSICAISALMVGVAHAENKIIKIDGSSTVYPITEAVAEEFQKANEGINVTVGISGTGGGFKKFCRGDTDVSNASRPIKDKEIKVCKEAGIEFIELPVALDAIAVVVNKANTWANDLTVEELNKIWGPEAQGKINNWSQVREGFPDKTLRLFGPGVDSGTFDYFTEAVNGKSQNSRGDFTASEDDNVLVQGVTGDEGSLGYFGLAYLTENENILKAVAIKNGADAEAVKPSVETAREGKYQPLSRPIFVYVNKKALAEKPEVKKFVEFYMNKDEAAKLVQEVGYVPLPDSAYEAFLKRVKDMKTGTAFKNVKGPVAISDLETMPVK